MHLVRNKKFDRGHCICYRCTNRSRILQRRSRKCEKYTCSKDNHLN